MRNIRAEDDALLWQLVRDPEQGIAALQAQYGGMIYRIVSRVLGNSIQDAEETAADVLVTAWQKAEMLLKQQTPLGPWLTVTARNRAIDRWRKLMRKPTVELNEEQSFLMEGQTSDGEDLIAELVMSMDSPDREIFLRRYYQMQTSKEIGAALGMDPHTVNVRLTRGRAKLRSQYLNKLGKELYYAEQS